MATKIKKKISKAKKKLLKEVLTILNTNTLLSTKELNDLTSIVIKIEAQIEENKQGRDALTSLNMLMDKYSNNTKPKEIITVAPKRLDGAK